MDNVTSWFYSGTTASLHDIYTKAGVDQRLVRFSLPTDPLACPKPVECHNLDTDVDKVVDVEKLTVCN